MEIKKCPFCNSDAHIVDYDTSLGYWVECDNCEATSALCNTEENAVEAWNKRTQTEIVRCKDCIYFQDRMVKLNDGTYRKYTEKEIDEGGVFIEVGINVGSFCKRQEDCISDGHWWCTGDDFCSRWVRKL